VYKRQSTFVTLYFQVLSPSLNEAISANAELVKIQRVSTAIFEK